MGLFFDPLGRPRARLAGDWPSEAVAPVGPGTLLPPTGTLRGRPGPRFTGTAPFPFACATENRDGRASEEFVVVEAPSSAESSFDCSRRRLFGELPVGDPVSVPNMEVCGTKPLEAVKQAQ